MEQSRVEVIAKPIMQKLYSASGASGSFPGTGGALGSFSSIGGEKDPSMEEVD